MNSFSALLVNILLLTVLQITSSANAHDLASSEHPACARYLGNEGVLVVSADTRVLFDAFYADSYGQYALVPETMRQALIKGQPPYHDIDALFVSHAHGDHFTAEPTLEFLRANPGVQLYASEQVIEILRETGADDIQSRLHAFALAAGDPAQSASVGSIEIDVVRIPHAGGQSRAHVENLAFRVSLNDTVTVLHLGDADPDDSLFARHQQHWDQKKLDTAFPPYWFLGSQSGRAVLDQRLRPAQTIGIHVPAAAAGNGDAWRIQYGGDLFTDPGETRDLNAAGCP